MRLYLCVVLLLVLGAAGPRRIAAAPAPACKADAGWNDPGPPQHVFGNTYYVGTCGISALLVTSDRGHILIDGATTPAGPMIEANIRALGFTIADIKYILATHAHLDHAGGFARLQHDSNAVMIARGADAAAIERGRGDRSDPQFLSIEGFPAVKPVRRVAACTWRTSTASARSQTMSIDTPTRPTPESCRRFARASRPSPRCRATCC